MTETIRIKPTVEGEEALYALRELFRLRKIVLDISKAVESGEFEVTLQDGVEKTVAVAQIAATKNITVVEQ